MNCCELWVQISCCIVVILFLLNKLLWFFFLMHLFWLSSNSRNSSLLIILTKLLIHTTCRNTGHILKTSVFFSPATYDLCPEITTKKVNLFTSQAYPETFFLMKEHGLYIQKNNSSVKLLVFSDSVKCLLHCLFVEQVKMSVAYWIGVISIAFHYLIFLFGHYKKCLNISRRT